MPEKEEENCFVNMWYPTDHILHCITEWIYIL
jgi:hypothetical protein